LFHGGSKVYFPQPETWATSQNSLDKPDITPYLTITSIIGAHLANRRIGLGASSKKLYISKPEETQRLIEMGGCK
jgi:hypothetical protein